MLMSYQALPTFCVCAAFSFSAFHRMQAWLLSHWLNPRRHTGRMTAWAGQKCWLHGYSAYFLAGANALETACPPWLAWSQPAQQLVQELVLLEPQAVLGRRGELQSTAHPVPPCARRAGLSVIQKRFCHGASSERWLLCQAQQLKTPYTLQAQLVDDQGRRVQGPILVCPAHHAASQRSVCQSWHPHARNMAPS